MSKAQNDLEERSDVCFSLMLRGKHYVLISSKIIRENEYERAAMDEKWFVYIIECKTKDLYVGIAKNVKQRVDLHNKGLACRYTKYRKPVCLKFTEACENYGLARKRERQIKKYSRVKKLALISRS